MSERVIATKRDFVGEGQFGEPALRGTEYVPDPEAPSVAEVVEVLREAGCRDCDGSGWLPVKGNGQSIKCEWCRNRDNLIARLEGA